MQELAQTWVDEFAYSIPKIDSVWIDHSLKDVNHYLFEGIEQADSIFTEF